MAAAAAKRASGTTEISSPPCMEVIEAAALSPPAHDHVKLRDDNVLHPKG
jgi:hypothetical protein